MDTAVPLRMIINELVSNSLKYAFSGRVMGEIQIKLQSNEKKKDSFNGTCFTLKVTDNGVGIPKTFEIETLNSLGFQLVTTLVDQLDGKFDLNRDNGMKLAMRFTLNEK
jgi:two-component sensor histidine kinase